MGVCLKDRVHLCLEGFMYTSSKKENAQRSSENEEVRVVLARDGVNVVGLGPLVERR